MRAATQNRNKSVDESIYTSFSQDRQNSSRQRELFLNNSLTVGLTAEYFLYSTAKSCSKKNQRLQFFLLLALRQFTYYK
ncbi:hypothetical protein C6Y56_20230 [Pseudomonas fluorescens]|uniref:Uncharacterized protein n=1 Tax=Pseudomonas fluorescens TaxID=294 RepID=A0A7Z3C736_PSEFL|nr:hypothetical protein C6Y56_20230 [Pseudomonas fluorescens]